MTATIEPGDTVLVPKTMLIILNKIDRFSSGPLWKSAFPVAENGQMILCIIAGFARAEHGPGVPGITHVNVIISDGRSAVAAPWLCRESMQFLDGTAVRFFYSEPTAKDDAFVHRKGGS